jgi:hypothetical protein
MISSVSVKSARNDSRMRVAMLALEWKSVSSSTNGDLAKDLQDTKAEDYNHSCLGLFCHLHGPEHGDGQESLVYLSVS